MSPKEHTTETIQQIIDIKRWIRSEISQVDVATAFREIIDNGAIDEAIPGKQALVIIDIDTAGNRVIFENRQTNGMDKKAMEKFIRFGQDNRNVNQIKEHGLGGKISLLSLLSEEKSTLTITSKSAGDTTLYRTVLNNWWQKLSHGETFIVESIPTNEVEKSGWTRFELENANLTNVPEDTTKLIDQFGVHYGPRLQKGEMAIKIRKHKKNGEVTSLQAVPTVIHFEASTLHHKDRVPVTGKGQGDVRIAITWGLIDQTKKEQDKLARQGIYGSKQVTQLQGDRCYVYYHGRLLGYLALADLKIPGYRPNRNTLQSFAVTVDIVEGWAPKTIFKDKLNVNAPETEKIYTKVANIIKDDVKKLMSDSESTSQIPETYKARTREANTALASTLTAIFDGNPSLIAKTFSLPLPESDSGFGTHEKNSTSNKDKQHTVTLPGIRSHNSPKNETSSSKRPTEIVWVNPIPEFTINSFPQVHPEAILNISDQGRPQIELNYNNAVIQAAFQQTRGKVFVTMLLRVAAETLYKEKWGKKYPDNSKLFAQGLAEDVALFLEAAKKSKVI